MRIDFGRLCRLILAGWLTTIQVYGQATNAPAAATTNAAPVAPVIVAVPLANVVTSAGQDTDKLQAMLGVLATDPATAQLQQNLPALIKGIDRQKDESDKILTGAPSLPSLHTAEAAWQMLSDGLNTSKDMLGARISELDNDEKQLTEMDQKWKATLASAKTSAPADVLGRINAVVTLISQTTKQISALRARILSLQVQVATQGARIRSGLDAVRKAEQSAVSLLFVRDSQPVWSMFGATSGTATPAPAGPSPFAVQFTQLRAYVAEKFFTIVAHLMIFNVFALVLFWVRKKVSPKTKEDPTVDRATQVFQMPLATAAVLALLVSFLLYPLAPRLFRAGLGAAALIPAVLILRRLIEPSLLPILFAMVIAYFVDQLRYVASVEPMLGRSIFLVEMVVLCLFLLWLLRSKRLSHVPQDRLERGLRIFTSFALLVFGVAALAQILGYTHLSYLVGNAMLGSSYLAVILYAAVRIGEGLILSGLKIRPFSSLGMVRRHEALLTGNISFGLRALVFLFWLWETLELFSVRPLIWNRAASILTYADPQGMVHPSLLARIILCGLTIWAMFLASRFIRFGLEEEVFPNLRLGAGVPYAISTMVHYIILILGVLAALNVVGIDLAKYSVLAGALGVGLGFGLQNIMNNFVSGLILLFERPIKVGDVIQLDATDGAGTVEKIGIRASVIRLTNGSEIIVPNGNLISNQVTNWTFSNRQRMIEVPITVAPKSDSNQVLSLLVATAKDHPLVLKSPPPQALLTNFGATGMTFELRAWTDNHDSWTKIRSDLALSISAALARENIAMS